MRRGAIPGARALFDRQAGPQAPQERAPQPRESRSAARHWSRSRRKRLPRLRKRERLSFASPSIVKLSAERNALRLRRLEIVITGQRFALRLPPDQCRGIDTRSRHSRAPLGLSERRECAR